MMKWLKYLTISIVSGVIATLLIGGILYATTRSGFDPVSSCSGDPLCEPNPYLNIGFPNRFGAYNDASDNTMVLGFNSEDPELASRYYKGFALNVMLYAAISLPVVVILSQHLQHRTARKP